MSEYKLEFILENIGNKSEDPWELHFKILNENDAEEINTLLRKNFTFKLKNNWIVSANDTGAFCRRGYKWYIKGSIGHIDGNKKYYRTDIKTSFHKKDFNKELHEFYPDIDKEYCLGVFNKEKNEMGILNKTIN